MDLDEFCDKVGRFGESASVNLQAGENVVGPKCLAITVDKLSLHCPSIDESILSTLASLGASGWVVVLGLLVCWCGAYSSKSSQHEKVTFIAFIPINHNEIF